MIFERIRNIIDKVREWQADRDREMEEWKESDPDAYYAFVMDQLQGGKPPM